MLLSRHLPGLRQRIRPEGRYEAYEPGKDGGKGGPHLAEGNTEYWRCDGCRNYYSDQAGTQAIDQADTVIPKLAGHTADGTGWHADEENHWNTCECGETLNTAAHTFAWITDKEATATEAGWKHEECTVCGYARAAVEIPATEEPAASDEIEDTPESEGDEEEAPQTDDSSAPLLWTALAAAGLAGAITFSRNDELPHV